MLKCVYLTYSKFACRIIVQYVKDRCLWLDLEEKRRLELQVWPIPLSLGRYRDYKLICEKTRIGNLRTILYF